MFNIWCGGAFGNQLRGCGGKTPGKVSGLQQREAGFQTGRPCGTNLLAAPSSGCPGSVQGDPQALFSALVPVIGPDKEDEGSIRKLREGSDGREELRGA